MAKFKDITHFWRHCANITYNAAPMKLNVINHNSLLPHVYCLGIGLDELRRSATIKLRDDSGWRSLYILSGSSARSISILIPGPQWTTAFGSILIRTAGLL
ncbi:uncharacterized protein UHOD_12001 [Ustilago sp. UG-2017b]|nr:uncharacterized protein UHOD_12001 [Ustilago sp. UG-2017b]